MLLIDRRLFRFVTKHAFDRQTDRRTDRQTDRKATARERSNRARCALKWERFEFSEVSHFCKPHQNRTVTLQLGIAILGLNFQSRDSGLSNSQSRDPGTRRDWRSIVKTTKTATWATVFGSLFLNYKCVRRCYGFSADVL